MKVLSIDTVVYPDVRDCTCSWLQANGLDPGMVVSGSPIQVDDDSITVTQFVLDGFGNRLLHRCCDAAPESHFAKRYLTVALVEPVPAELEAYVVVSA